MTKKIIILSSLAATMILATYYIFPWKKDEIDLVKKNPSNIFNKKSTIFKRAQVKPTTPTIQDDEEKDPLKMEPAEYVNWVKDTRGRKLVATRNDGVFIYQKGNVQITVLPDGEELYLPKEI